MLGCRWIQITEPQQVRNRGAVKTDLLCDLLMGQCKLVRKATEGLGTLDRVEILSLNILDDGKLGSGLIIDRSHDGGDLRQSNELRRAPSTLTSDQFIA